MFEAVPREVKNRVRGLSLVGGSSYCPHVAPAQVSSPPWFCRAVGLSGSRGWQRATFSLDSPMLLCCPGGTRFPPEPDAPLGSAKPLLDPFRTMASDQPLPSTSQTPPGWTL